MASTRPATAPFLTEPSAGAIALAGLLALAVSNGIGRFAFTPVLPMMQQQAGLSVADGGLLASANYVGYLVGAMWATMHRVQPLQAIRLGLLTTTLATIAMGAAQGFVTWSLLRLVAGISSAWVMIQASAWCLDRLAHRQRPQLGGVLFAGVGAGIVVAGIVCLALMGIGARWESAWFALGAIALGATASIWPLLGRDSVHKAPMDATPAGFRWTGEAIRAVYCYGVFGLGYIIPGTFVPTMARQTVQDPFVFGLAWPLFGAAAAASTVLAVRWTRLHASRLVWRWAAATMAVGVVSPLLLPGMWGIVAAALLVGSTLLVVTMAAMQEARRLAGPHAAVLIAAMTSAFAAGQILGPLLVSLLAQRANGFSTALWIAFAALLSSVLLLRRTPGVTSG